MRRKKDKDRDCLHCGHVAKGYAGGQAGVAYCGKSKCLILLNEPCQYWTEQKGEIPILWDMIRGRE